MKQITNLTTRPVVLSDGTILAAAGTKGAAKQTEKLSDADARRLSGSIHVIDVVDESAPKPAAGAAGRTAARTSRSEASGPEGEGESKK